MAFKILPAVLPTPLKPEELLPGDIIVNPMTTRLVTVRRVETPTAGITRVVLRTGKLIDFRRDAGTFTFQVRRHTQES